MKIFKALAVVTAAVLITGNIAFAAPDVTNSSNKNETEQKIDTVKRTKGFKGKDFKCRDDEAAKCKDPIEALKNKKEKIVKLLDEGKIAREKADEIIARIDSKIKEIEEFNKLTVEQKKEKLIKDFKTNIQKKVEDGKLTQEKADELVKNFTEKVQKWDGTGYPRFFERHSKLKKHKMPNKE